jgi:2-oxoisovalerate dehydrogenase E1 component
MGVHWANAYSQENENISLTILDLRSLAPLDYEAIEEAVAITGKVVVLHEDNLTGGIGGEISAWIAEHVFTKLDAPIMRCASLDTPIPFNIELEKQYLAKSRLHETMQRLLKF